MFGALSVLYRRNGLHGSKFRFVKSRVWYIEGISKVGFVGKIYKNLIKQNPREKGLQFVIKRSSLYRGFVIPKFFFQL